MKIVPAEFKKQMFNCPFCNAFAEQIWSNNIWYNYTDTCGQKPRTEQVSLHPSEMTISKCRACQELSIWKRGILVYPTNVNIDPPNSDLPEDIQNDYNEAKNILHFSPRGAAALLRLAIQKLCKELGASGDNINHDIGFLKKNKGLSDTLIMALDAVRIIGNNAVHPGRIDFNDNPEIAYGLFEIINMICSHTISEEKTTSALLQRVASPGELQQIQKRDS